MCKVYACIIDVIFQYIYVCVVYFMLSVIFTCSSSMVIQHRTFRVVECLAVRYRSCCALEYGLAFALTD